MCASAFYFCLLFKNSGLIIIYIFSHSAGKRGHATESAPLCQLLYYTLRFFNKQAINRICAESIAINR